MQVLWSCGINFWHTWLVSVQEGWIQIYPCPCRAGGSFCLFIPAALVLSHRQ
jgi:hypothetical protein